MQVPSKLDLGPPSPGDANRLPSDQAIASALALSYRSYPVQIYIKKLGTGRAALYDVGLVDKVILSVLSLLSLVAHAALRARSPS